MKEYRALIGPVVVVALVVIAALWSPFEPHRPPVPDAPAPPSAPLGSAPHPRAPWSDESWTAFAEKVAWATDHGVAQLPLGEAIVTVGRSWVGAPYVPGTLEVEGPERVVIDFSGFDCVTFVENTLATTWFVRMGGSELVAVGDRARAETLYEALLGELRYREGLVSYPTRLHYFSDWITHNSERGLVEDITGSFASEVDDESIDFMTRHTEAYPQLSDPAFVEAIAERERELSARGRRFVPQSRIGEVAGDIRNGDVIAATSTVPGLDVAHTGIALWLEGSLHLMHAPLVGEAVQISAQPLADRIARIDGQDGIIVARPREHPGSGRSR